MGHTAHNFTHIPQGYVIVTAATVLTNPEK